MAADAKPNTRETHSEEPDWRELLKPLFMEMYRRGIKDVRLVRDGGKCQMTMTLDVDPIPDADADADLVGDDFDDDDFDDDGFEDDDGPGDGPLEYLERTAEK